MDSIKSGEPAANADGSGAAPEETASRQFVTFYVDSETFAVPLAEVQEIIRMPQAVKLPLSPPSLEGLANLRGAVLPVVNMRKVLGCGQVEHDDATRVIVLDQGRPVGLVVDRMANVLTVENDRIESVDTIRSSIDTDLLTGMIKGADAAQGMVMVLDAAALIGKEIRSVDGARAKSGRDAAAPAGHTPGQGAEAGETDADIFQLVSFMVDGQEYAFPIEQVQEIVQSADSVMKVPNAPSFVLGVVTLRDRLLPLISLRSLFGLSQRGSSEHDRIVVISLGRDTEEEISVGVVMDSVKEVLRVNRALVDPMPPLLAREHGLADMTSICRLDGGKRLVSVLAAERMFQRNASLGTAIDSLGKTRQEEAALEQHGTAGADDEGQFVIFRLLNEEYGVSIGSVQEIVRVPEQLTQIPRTADFIEGVVNLRGTVLPVIDQRRRFGLAGCERNDRQRIMVFTVRGIRTGFIVDQVSEVMRISHKAIGPAPDLSEEQRRLIREVANLEEQKRMILLLDVEQMLDAVEITELKQAS